MAPSLTEQYQIFKLEQSEGERMALEQNDNTMDMASYAEFQRQFKGLKEAHKAVLLAIRSFWQVLTRHDVTYGSLVDHFKKVEKTQMLVRSMLLCGCGRINPQACAAKSVMWKHCAYVTVTSTYLVCGLVNHIASSLSVLCDVATVQWMHFNILLFLSNTTQTDLHCRQSVGIGKGS